MSTASLTEAELVSIPQGSHLENYANEKLVMGD